MDSPLHPQQIEGDCELIKNRIVRGSIAGTAVLIPLAGVTAVAVNPAAAAKTGITCSKLSGTVNTTANTSVFKLKTCTGNTGTSGKAKGTASSSITTATIKWKNGKSTTTGNIQLGTGTLCPATNSGGFSLVADETESGTVTADTTGSTAIGAASSAEVCVYDTATTGVYSLNNAPGTKFVIAP